MPGGRLPSDAVPNVTLYNPTTEEAISSLPSASVEETDAAVAKAKAAGPVWRAPTTAEVR